VALGKTVLGKDVLGKGEVQSAGSSVTLAIQDSTHAHAADNFALSANGAESLTIQEAAHGHAGDNITLSAIPVVNYRIVPTGDSNASGRGSFSQTNSASSAYLFDNSGNVVALSDPYDGGSGQTYSALDDGVSAGGSYVQHLADLLGAAGKSVMFIPANRGGTQASDWTATTAGTKYEALKNRVNAAGGDGSDLIFLIHLGANDANSAVAQATFKSRIETFIGNLNADFPLAKKYLQKVHHFSSAPAGTVDTIRAGVDDVWNGSSGCLRGADLDGITTSIHYGSTGVPGTCTSELNEVALRTFNAITSLDLIVADSAHGHAVDTVALATTTPLVVSDAIHAHGAEVVTLNTAAALSVQEAAHAHVADALGLSTILSISIQDSAHSHTADNLTMSGTGAAVLLIQEALHAHFSDGVNLSTMVSLIVSETSHGHYSDIAVLSLPGAGGGGPLSPSDISAIADAVWAKLLGGIAAGSRLSMVAEDTVTALNATTIPVNAVDGAWPTANETRDAVWNKVLP
jgi:hypothetical protein